MFRISDALQHVIESEGSDLHLKVPAPPLVRVHGELRSIPGTECLKPEDTQAALDAMLNDPAKREEFDRAGEVDFAYAVPGLARFRVNAFRQRGSISIVARAIPFGIRSAVELGLPAVIADIAEEERGMILLTGTTGSGKSTTLAAIIDQINRSNPRHIVTIEDPIEYLHSDQRSIINQREVGTDTGSFAAAMRRVLRQDPDVILIGEMRDEETVRTALSAAETGHLVLSTVHTIDAAETINRIIDFFPPHEQHQARAMLAGTLRAVVSQRLVRTPTGDGRVAVCEILRMTGRARDMIMDPDETGRLREVIAEGSYYGMQTFDQALLDLHQAGRVSIEDALRVASSPHDFKLLVASQGRTATTMDDLQDAAQSGTPNGAPASSPAGAVPSAQPATAGAVSPIRNGSTPPPTRV